MLIMVIKSELIVSMSTRNGNTLVSGSCTKLQNTIHPLKILLFYANASDNNSYFNSNNTPDTIIYIYVCKAKV